MAARRVPILSSPRSVWRHIALAMIVLFVGVVVGANWSYAGRLFRFTSFEEFLRNVPALALIVTIFGLFATVGGLLYQNFRARFNLEIDLCLQMTRLWDSESMQKARAEGARSLLKDRREGNDQVDTVADYFEDLGFLVSREAITPRSAWQFFAAIVMPYFEVTTDYRLQNHTDDPEIWLEFHRLYDMLLREEAAARQQAGKGPYKPWSLDDLHHFLLSEARLVRVERTPLLRNSRVR